MVSLEYSLRRESGESEGMKVSVKVCVILATLPTAPAQDEVPLGVSGHCQEVHSLLPGSQLGRFLPRQTDGQHTLQLVHGRGEEGPWMSETRLCYSSYHGNCEMA